MKKIITLTLALLVLSTFKINAQNTFPNSDSVINYLKGGWNWFKSCGGVGGICIYPTSPGVGYTKSIRFNRISGFNDSITYSIYKNSSLISSGATKVLFNNSQSSWYLRSVKDEFFVPLGFFLLQCQADSVRFLDMCSDCYMRTFYRDQTVGLSTNTIDPIKVNLYPIPSADKITLEIESSVIVEKIIFLDLNGSQVFLPQLSRTEFNVSGLSQGVYFVKIISESKQYWSKFLKH